MEMTGRMPEWKANLVSVIMPAHNSQASLEESARSVAAQTYPDWELLIVDDASTDSTLETARELALDDARIRIVPLTQNVGVAAARNHGIAAARGQYIAFLDSDDLWLPHKLKTQIEFMQNSGAAFSFAEYRRFNSSGMLSKPIKVPSRAGYEQLLRGNVIGCLTVTIDRFTIPQVSMPSIKHEDYVTWLGILRQGHVAWGIHEDLARYRLTSTSVSADKKRAASWTWNIYRHVEGLSFAKSVWCFVNYFLHAIYVRCIY